MTFPVYLHAGPWTFHPHTVFELLAYFVGFRLYLWQRRRRGDVVGGHERWSIVAAAVVGAALGSKILYWLEDPCDDARADRGSRVPAGRQDGGRRAASGGCSGSS